MRFRRAPYEHVAYAPGDVGEIEVYLSMVRMATHEDLGFAEIANRLNARRVPPPSGEGAWCGQTVGAILEHPAYRGDGRLFHRSSGEYLTLGPDRRPAPVPAEHRTSIRPLEQQLVKPNAHVGLISREEWEALQRAIAGRGRNRNGRRANQFTLRSERVVPAVICAHCGRPMIWVARYDGLFCSGYKHCGSSVCKNYVADAAPLARLLWSAHAGDVKKLLGTTNLAERLKERVGAILAERGRTLTTAPTVDANELRRRRTELVAEAERLAGLSKESLEILDAKLKRLTAEKREIDRLLEQSRRPRAATSDLDAATEAVMERVELLTKPYEEVSRDTARTVLAAAVRPDSIRLTFARPKHYRQQALVAKVEADLIDPRDGLVLAAVPAEPGLALPTSTS